MQVEVGDAVKQNSRNPGHGSEGRCAHETAWVLELFEPFSVKGDDHPDDDRDEEETGFRYEMEVVVVGHSEMGSQTRGLVLSKDGFESSGADSHEGIVRYHLHDPAPGHHPGIKAGFLLFFHGGFHPFHHRGAYQGDKGQEQGSGNEDDEQLLADEMATA